MKNFLLKNSNLLATPLSSISFWLFCLVFVLFPLGQLTRIPLGSGAMYAHEVVMLVIVLLQAKVICEKLPALFSRLHSKQHLLLRLFLAWVALGITLSLLKNFDLTQVLYLVRIIVYGLFTWSAYTFFAGNKMVLRVLLLLAGVWYTWLAILQYFFIPDTRFLWIFGWDDHYYRMIGTLFDPGLTGILLLLSFLVSYSLWKQLPRLLTVGITTITLASVLLTYSRASYLSAVVAVVLLISWEYRNWKERMSLKKLLLILTILMIASVGLYLSLPKPGGEGVKLLRTSTITARLTTATTALETMQPMDWVIGRGLFSPADQNISAVDTESSQTTKATMPDNIFITLISQTGIIGLILGSGVLIQGIKKLWGINRVLAVALIAVLVQSQFNNTLLHPYILLYLGIFIASYDLRTTFRSSST